MNKYFIKLINNSKIETNELGFKQWLYNTGDDYIICYGDSGIPVYVKKSRILLGYVLEIGENNE